MARFLGIGILLGAAALGLGGCTDGYGYGYGGGLGYNSGRYYDGYYGNDIYGDYNLAGGPAYYGWYGDYYYPGTGGFVYDRRHRARPWNDDQRRYWEGRRGSGDRGSFRDNWSGFDRNRRDDRRDFRGDRGRGFDNGARDRYRGEGRGDGRGFRRDGAGDGRQPFRGGGRRSRRD